MSSEIADPTKNEEMTKEETGAVRSNDHQNQVKTVTFTNRNGLLSKIAVKTNFIKEHG